MFQRIENLRRYTCFTGRGPNETAGQIEIEIVGSIDGAPAELRALADQLELELKQDG